MGKRKNGALRKRDFRFDNDFEAKTFYMNPSKTIDFNQGHSKAKPNKQIELIPKSVNQEKYILALQDSETDIVVVSGPAGTGKTYLGMLAAIKALRSSQCRKIILTRPAVPADDEKHGFLPGDLNSKMEPWVRPLFDILREYYSEKELKYMIEDQIIEITPLAFCRGRTFKNAWVICDEMQNASPNLTKMVMTRIGENSKIIITGDTDQTDRKIDYNGLLDITNRLVNTPVKGITTCFFENKDVQRHKLIDSILKLYG